jgi:hypothetical protein
MAQLRTSSNNLVCGLQTRFPEVVLALFFFGDVSGFGLLPHLQPFINASGRLLKLRIRAQEDLYHY